MDVPCAFLDWMKIENIRQDTRSQALSFGLCLSKTSITTRGYAWQKMIIEADRIKIALVSTPTNHTIKMLAADGLF